MPTTKRRSARLHAKFVKSSSGMLIFALWASNFDSFIDLIDVRDGIVSWNCFLNICISYHIVAPTKRSSISIHYFFYFYFNNQVHTERPTPQMHKERKAMILLRRVVEASLDGGGGNDWKFCLLTGSLLSEISMNNVTKGNYCAI